MPARDYRGNRCFQRLCLDRECRCTWPVRGRSRVRKRLLIRAGGHVSGTVTYGEIEIEAGGGISGTIEQAGASNADRISLSA